MRILKPSSPRKQDAVRGSPRPEREELQRHLSMAGEFHPRAHLYFVTERQQAGECKRQASMAHSITAY
jgi:hypothetical protein